MVGDDAQSIYSFRAAEVRNILDFPGQFQPPARVVMLERNYRSTQPILAAANAVIGEAAERFKKSLWSERASAERPQLVTVRDETQQADYVCSAVLDARESGIALKSQAVLFRTSHHSGPLEIELTRRNIPFVKFGGLKFLEAAHVKDVLAVLRFAQNPRDRVAGFRVLQLLPGIGPATAEAIIEAMTSSLDPTMALPGYRVPSRAAADWPGFVDPLHDTPQRPRRLASRISPPYGSGTSRSSSGCTRTRRCGVRISSSSRRWRPASAARERFLTDLTLDPPSATSDQAGVPLLDEDYLILSTIHSAKGQEWTQVFVLNCVDGCIPSDLATGSQRRDRGGAPAALRGDDQSQGSPAFADAAALLHPWPAWPRRPPCLCGTQPFRAGFDPRSLHQHRLAAGHRRSRERAGAGHAHRRQGAHAPDVELSRARLSAQSSTIVQSSPGS